MFGCAPALSSCPCPVQDCCLALEGSFCTQVQVNLDDTGSVQFGRLMRVETTIEELYHQMPPLVLQVLKTKPQAVQQQFRLLPQSSSRSSKPFDLDCHSSITLKDVMYEYLPGTFEFKLQLLCEGEPVNVEELLVQPHHHRSPAPASFRLQQQHGGVAFAATMVRPPSRQTSMVRLPRSSS